ncbi:MAG: hypothetical protein ACE5G2_13355, partial [Candidatus Krumholzibacteriia bacterium]
WIYQAIAPGQWTLVGRVEDPQPNNLPHLGIYRFDLNQNGKPELIWAGSPTTLILEHRTGTSDVGGDTGPTLGSLASFPNPSREQAELRMLAGADAVTCLSVFDVAGRLVERRMLRGDSKGRILWPTAHLASAVYLLRLEDANRRPLAVGRGIVMR